MNTSDKEFQDFSAKKRRGKLIVYGLAFVIGMPLLYLAGMMVTTFENNSAQNGIVREDGSVDYHFKGKADELPAITDDFLAEYPDSKIIYFNITKLPNGKLSGSATFFSDDNFEQIKNFYENSLSESISEKAEKSIKFLKNNQEFVIREEKILDDDVIKTWTKVEIRFYK